MRWHIHLGLPFATGLGVTAVALSLTPVQAASADYCVTCKGPAETYKCRVQARVAAPGDALKLYCIIRTAQEGGHASCSAKKATSACGGIVKAYTYDGPSLPEGIASDQRVRDLNRRLERNRQIFEEPSGEEPKSLFELGGRAVDASRRGLRSAGSVIGLGSPEDEETSSTDQPLPPDDPVLATQTAPADTSFEAAENSEPDSPGFARRSYNCVISLFRECGRGD